LKYPLIRAIINTIARTVRPIRRLIHSGEITQIQGQEINPVNFRPINSTVSKPGKPIPLEEEELLDIYFVSTEVIIDHKKGAVKPLVTV
jgi:hypothetical protein